MEKVTRDGKVAVLYSPGFGSGWYSWNSDEEQLLFHPKIVELVEEDRRNEITNEFIEETLGIDAYVGGAEDLEIEWIPIGTRFRIEEYDGAETIFLESELDLKVA